MHEKDSMKHPHCRPPVPIAARKHHSRTAQTFSIATHVYASKDSASDATRVHISQSCVKRKARDLKSFLESWQTSQSMFDGIRCWDLEAAVYLSRSPIC
jgi:hypothetical protein